MMRNHWIMNAWAMFVAAAMAPCGLLAAPLDFKLPAETARLRPSPQGGYDLAVQKCGICHSADYIAYQPPALTMPQWTAEVAKMKHTYGAPISDDDVARIGAYLGVTYGSAKAGDRDVVALAGPATNSTSGSSTADPQSMLEKNGCLGCHSVAAKIVGPAYKDVAARYKADPNAQQKLEASIRGGSSGKWGTAAMPPFPALAPADLSALVEFVRKQ